MGQLRTLGLSAGLFLYELPKAPDGDKLDCFNNAWSKTTRSFPPPGNVSERKRIVFK
jgi:hypothetical protein